MVVSLRSERRRRRGGARKTENTTMPARQRRKRILIAPGDDDDDRPPVRVASTSTLLVAIIVFSTASALYASVRRSGGVARFDAASVRGMQSTPLRGNRDAGGGAGLITTTKNEVDGAGPTIRSLADLTEAELHPRAGPTRHIVTPPADQLPIKLVTCTTTVGYLHVSVILLCSCCCSSAKSKLLTHSDASLCSPSTNQQILVHPSWAPLGAERFLEMVTSKYFSSKVVR